MADEEKIDIENRALSTRMLDAIDAFRGDSITSLGVANIRHERKAKPVAPDLGQRNPFLPYDRSPAYWNSRFSKTTDYRHEVGNLDLNSLAMAVVNFTANRIPEAKPAVARPAKDGEPEIDLLHPAARLIRRPNNHHVWANYAAAISMGWWFAGNVYILKVRSIPGEVIELWLLPHSLVEPRWPGDGRSPDVPQDRNNDRFLSHYQYTPPGKSPVLYPARDVIHLKRGIDLARPRLGLGAFESLYKELYGDDRMSLYIAAVMSNMGLQVPVISPNDKDVTITETQAMAMKEGWMQKTTGTRAGEPVILTEPVKVEKFGFPPADMDLSQNRLMPESRVCAVCQISPAALQVMVGIQNGTSYASSEQARQQGYEEVIIPIQAVWAEEFTHQLLPEFDDSEGAEFVFDTSKVRVLEDDHDKLVERESKIFSAGGSTLDQYLTAVGKRPVGPPLGDIRMVPGLSTPMSPEQLLERAMKAPEPAVNQPPIDPATLAKFVDMEQMFERLEKEMKGFVTK